MVKRWAIEDSHGWQHVPEERNYGNWVRYTDYEALAARMEASIDYSIKLQQLIENLKYPKSEVPFPELHHHKMIVAAKACIRELEAALTSVLAQPDNPTIWFGVVRGCFKSERRDEHG